MTYNFASIRYKLTNNELQYYMRNRQQEAYHPKNIKDFTTESLRIAYILGDIADLVTDSEISVFLDNMCNKLQRNKAIKTEELELIKLSLRKCYKACNNNHYVDVGSVYEIHMEQ